MLDAKIPLNLDMKAQNLHKTANFSFQSECPPSPTLFPIVQWLGVSVVRAMAVTYYWWWRPALAVRASNTPWKIREQSRVHPCLRGLGNTSGYSQARDLLAHQTIRTNLFCQHNRLFSSAVTGFKILYFNNWFLVGPIWKYVNLGEINLIKFRLSRGVQATQF